MAPAHNELFNWYGRAIGVPITHRKDLPTRRPVSYETDERLGSPSSILRKQRDNHGGWGTGAFAAKVAPCFSAPKGITADTCASLSLETWTLERQSPEQGGSLGYKSTGSPGEDPSSSCYCTLTRRSRWSRKLKILKIYMWEERTETEST